jgi:hypothetical protein
VSGREASKEVTVSILGLECAIRYHQAFAFNRSGLDSSGFPYVSYLLRGSVRLPWVRMPALLLTGSMALGK